MVSLICRKPAVDISSDIFVADARTFQDIAFRLDKQVTSILQIVVLRVEPTARTAFKNVAYEALTVIFALFCHNGTSCQQIS